MIDFLLKTTKTPLAQLLGAYFLPLPFDIFQRSYPQLKRYIAQRFVRFQTLRHLAIKMIIGVITLPLNNVHNHPRCTPYS